MMLRGFMSSRGEGSELHDGDMFFVLDNCFHHHSKELVKCFATDDGKALALEKHLIYINIDEDSLRQRRGLVRPS